MHAFTSTLRQTGQLVRSQRMLWLPFLVVAFVEVLLIGLIWLAPHPPFSNYLAPPIRYFFTDRVLHYPWHLWFLYLAMKHTYVAASLLVGAFMTGVACAMVRQVHEGRGLSLREALVSRQVRYSRVVILWCLSWLLAKGFLGALTAAAPKAPWVVWVSVAAMITLQWLVVYAIPASVFEGSKWWKAIVQGVQESLRYPFSTLAVVALFTAPVIAFSILAPVTRLVDLILQTTPEIALVFVVGRLVVWTICDACLTVAVAHLWWIHRAQPVAGRVDVAPVRRVPHGRIEEGPAVA